MEQDLPRSSLRRNMEGKTMNGEPGKMHFSVERGPRREAFRMSPAVWNGCVKDDADCANLAIDNGAGHDYMNVLLMPRPAAQGAPA